MPDIFLYQGEPNPNDVRLRNPLVPSGVTPTVDGWWRNNDNPVLRKAVPIAAMVAGLFFVEPTKADSLLPTWNQPASEPVRQKPRQQPSGETRTDVVVSAEVVTMDKWYQQPSEPIRPKLLQQPSGEYRFEIPRTILLSDWFQAASEPVRRPFRQTLGGDVRVDLENITIDKWGQPTNQPFFVKRRDVNTGEFRYELPREILLTDWYQQTSEPVKAKVRQLLGGEFRTDLVTSEIVTLDKWFAEIVQPYFARRRDANFGEVQVINPDLFPPPIPPSPVVPADQVVTSGGATSGGMLYLEERKIRELIAEDEELIELIKIFLKVQ